MVPNQAVENQKPESPRDSRQKRSEGKIFPKRPCLTFEEVVENSKTVQEFNENVQKYSDENNTTVMHAY
jgi:hypothetical protein